MGNVPALLRALQRLAILKWLGTAFCALAMLCVTAATASALEGLQTKTRVWGFELAGHHSVGLSSPASPRTHPQIRRARSEVASDSPHAARGAGRAGADIVGKAGHAGLRPTQLSVDRSIVEKYAGQLRAGQKVDPIHAVEVPGGQRYIIEGHHRYVASQQTGIPVEVVVKPGGGPVGFDWKDVVYEVFTP